MRTILTQALQGLNVRQILEARDHKEALQELRNAPIDVVITDWEMEGGGGFALLKGIRAGSEIPNPLVPVIVVSANTIAGNVIKARESGMTEFLAKPVSAKSLYTRIVSIIENPRKFVRTESFFGPDRRRKFDPDYSGPKRRDEDKS